MKHIYLSYFLNEDTPIYGGEKAIFIENRSEMSNGDSSNTKYLKFPNHSGTHIDFPLHFSDKGKNINDYPPEFWIFKEVGFIESSVDNIQENFSGLNKNIEFLIIKTGFGKHRYQNRYWSKQPIILSSLAAEIKRNFPKIS